MIWTSIRIVIGMIIYRSIY